LLAAHCELEKMKKIKSDKILNSRYIPQLFNSEPLNIQKEFHNNMQWQNKDSISDIIQELKICKEQKDSALKRNSQLKEKIKKHEIKTNLIINLVIDYLIQNSDEIHSDFKSTIKEKLNLSLQNAHSLNGNTEYQKLRSLNKFFNKDAGKIKSLRNSNGQYNNIQKHPM